MQPKICGFQAIYPEKVQFSWAIHAKTQINNIFFLCFISAAVACKPPVTEVEKVDQNLAARLLNYDVDKATEHIQSQLDELMKEMECDMEDDDDIE